MCEAELKPVLWENLLKQLHLHRGRVVKLHHPCSSASNEGVLKPSDFRPLDVSAVDKV